MTATAKVGVELTLDNGKTFSISEGDIVTDLSYKLSDGSVATITGAIRVIKGVTKSNTSFTNTCPPESYLYKYVSVTGFVVDISEKYDADLVSVSTNMITDIGSVSADPTNIVVGPGPEYATLDKVIENAEVGSTITLMAGQYEAPLSINKSISIKGTGDVELRGKIEIGSEASTLAEGSEKPVVSIEGVTLTDDATVKVAGNIAALTIKGVKFVGHNLTAKTMPIAITSTVTEPMELTITGCEFGDQNSYSYNLIDVYAPLSVCNISDNTFTEECCTHNHVSLYGINDGGVIHLDNNKIAMSRNFVRIGFKGEPTGSVYMTGNTYDKTDESNNGEWAGLALVQPYGSQTTSFAGVTIAIDDTVNNTEYDQLIYLYAGGSDTKFTDDNKPVITIDGVDKTAEIPVLG